MNMNMNLRNKFSGLMGSMPQPGQDNAWGNIGERIWQWKQNHPQPQQWQPQQPGTGGGANPWGGFMDSIQQWRDGGERPDFRALIAQMLANRGMS